MSGGDADADALQNALAWLEHGHRVALATVAKTWGSSPRPPGSMLAIRADGRLAGSVSGGCVEQDLIERVRDLPPGLTKPGVLVYGGSPDNVQRFGLPCGGTLQLVLEPGPKADGLRPVLEAITRRELIARRLHVATGRVELHPAAPADGPTFDGQTLTTVHGPRWRLLIIGAGQPSRYLAQMAPTLGYRVTVCDPRKEYAGAWDIAGTELVTTMPDDAVTACRPDARCAVVALTHDPKLDDLALLEALKSEAFYVGALGSRTTNAKRRARLLLFDLGPAQLARLHGPVGLPIGSRTPPEIAVSILAEMTAVRYGVSLPQRQMVAEAAAACP